MAEDYHPPLYSTFSFLWLRVFGDSELSIRVPPLLFGLATIVLTYVLARRWFGPEGALLPAVLLALSPVHVWYSQEARAYSFDAFIVLFLIWAYYRLHDADGSRWAVLLYGAAACVTGQAEFFLLAFPGMLALLCIARRCQYSKQVIASAVVSALLLFGFLLFKASQGTLVTQLQEATGSTYLRPMTPYELWLLLFQWFSTGGTLWAVNAYGGLKALLAQPAPLALQVALCAIFLVGLVRVVWASGSRRDLALLLFGLPVALGLLSVVWRHVYIERSMIPVLPLFIIVLAAGAMAIRIRGLRYGVIASLVLLSAASTIAMYARPSDWTVYKPKEDWQGLAAYLDAAEPQQRQPIFSDSPGAPGDELSYYRPWIQRVNKQMLTAPDMPVVPVPSDIASLLLVAPTMNPCESSASREAAGLFIIHTGVLSLNDDPQFKSLLTRMEATGGCQLVDTQRFRSVEVYHFQDLNLAD
jgi:uncharacterized membrane protein